MYVFVCGYFVWLSCLSILPITTSPGLLIVSAVVGIYDSPCMYASVYILQLFFPKLKSC